MVTKNDEGISSTRRCCDPSVLHTKVVHESVRVDEVELVSFRKIRKLIAVEGGNVAVLTVVIEDIDNRNATREHV